MLCLLVMTSVAFFAQFIYIEDAMVKGNISAVLLTLAFALFLCGRSSAEPDFICGGVSQKRAKLVPGEVLESKGEQNVLVIFARFAGEAPADSLAPSWAGGLFNPDLPGSFTHFYLEMSDGALLIKGSVLKKRYVSKHGPGHYVRGASDGDEGGYGDFNREILEAVDREVDFSLYDVNNDGYVDYFIFIILRSIPSGFIKGPAVGILGLGLDRVFVTNDRGGPHGNILISDGATLRGRGFSYTVALMAHEYGHALGLPDLYDTEIVERPDLPPEEDSAGIGRWGLMGYGALGWNDDDGPNPLSAWSREKLGWLEGDRLRIVYGFQSNVVIGNVWEGGAVYKIIIGPGEYFLIENRGPSGYYDRHIPQSGLLIWHVYWSGNNNDETLKKVDLECADGLYDDKGYPGGRRPDPDSGRDNLDFWAHDENYRKYHYGNMGDATDVFDGERFTAFTPETNPNSIGYFETTFFGITNIRRQGKDMVVDFRFDFLASRITRPAEWSGNVFVSKDIIIEPGATLTIDSGTIVRFATTDELQSGVDPSRPELIVRGELRINKGPYWSPVRLTTRGEGSWYGVRLEGDSVDVAMENCIIENAQVGVSGENITGNLVMSDVVIKGSVYDGVNLGFREGNLDLVSTTIRGNGAAGLKIRGTVSVGVRDSEILDNDGHGIQGEGLKKIYVYRSVIQDNKGDGISLSSWRARSSITGSGISSNQNGIVIVGEEDGSSGELLISDNTILDNNVGILSLSSSARLVGNRLKGNLYALECDGSAVPSLDGLNIIVDNVWAVLNLTAIEISAPNNWWGTSDPVVIASRIQGPVDWQPYLKVDPDSPQILSLDQNFPNPFGTVTRIPFRIPLIPTDPQRLQRVTIVIYDVLGRRIRRLFDGEAEAGPHVVLWDGKDEQGRDVAGGLYICRMEAGNFRRTRRMVLIR